MILAGTGHRPEGLGLSYRKKDGDLLRSFVRAQLETIEGVDRVISGGALGFDQALAGAALDLSIPLTFTLPFSSIASRWPTESREHFNSLLERADGVEVVGGSATKSAYLDRNRHMVNHCTHLLALWDGQPGGGTAYTVRYAKGLGRPVRNLWGIYLKGVRVS